MRQCRICKRLGFESNHLIGACKYYSRLIQIGKELNKNSNPKAKKCSLCRCKGHNCKKCILLNQLIQEIEESNLEQSDND